MIDDSLVSVIIPTRNRSEYLRRAISSVIDQTYSNLECIVVDDNSSDNTYQIVKSIHDERIVFFQHNKNRGASAARNTGIKNSRGEFIAFLDDDDEWIDKKLEKQVPLLKKLSSSFGMVYCWMDYYDNKGNIIHKHHPTLNGYVFNKVLDTQRLGGCPTLLVRREVFDELQGFDESLPRGNDGDFIRRVCRKYDVEFVPEVLVKVYTAHGFSRISDYDPEGLHNAIIGEKAKLKKFSQELIELPKIHAAILLKIANHYSKLGEKSKAIQMERKAIKLDKIILLKKLYYSFPNLIQRYVRYIYRMGQKLEIVLIKLQDHFVLIIQRLSDRYRVNKLEKIYSKEWVEECLDVKWDNDIQNFTRVVFNEFRPASVVDVGCGLGLYLKYYKELGSKKILGIEANRNALEKALISEILPHDLRKPLKVNEKYELVSCLEVAEHLHRKYSNILVDTLVQLCDPKGYIIFTAAPPGQGGVHHINLQPQNFWIDLFDTQGFVYSRTLTSEISIQLEFQHLWWTKKNLMIFVQRPEG
jgi:glycosyltransferase involved in cell wall biosynthesis|tara:strand:+ start:1760 stop:3343 length:1584 start_codon:yes stop_codon:yes gene_type:complete